MRKITLQAVKKIRKGIEYVMWMHIVRAIAEPRLLPMLKQFCRDIIALMLAVCDLGLEKVQKKLGEVK